MRGANIEYLLARYEDNGYHDSYFYAVVWNSVEKKIKDIMEGATAFPGGKAVAAIPLKEAPARIKAAFRKWACHRAAEIIVAADEKYCAEPADAKIGEKMVVLRDVHPRKAPMVPKGVVGEVFWSGAFGVFYRNGYNKPNRENIRVGLELEDGEHVFVALKHCRRAMEPKALKDVEKRMLANYDNHEFNVAALCGCRAWLSENYLP